jgi:hypothetical protein
MTKGEQSPNVIVGRSQGRHRWEGCATALLAPDRLASVTSMHEVPAR